MNILFVNGFGSSPSGKARFNSFTNIIKSILKKISQKSGMGIFYINSEHHMILMITYMIMH